MKVLLIFASMFFPLLASADSRFHFDAMKLNTLLTNLEVEDHFIKGPKGDYSSMGWPIENVKLVSIQKKDILYTITSSNCSFDVHLTWDDDNSMIDPKYRVTSVGSWACN